MGKALGILLMILGAVIFFWGTTFVAENPYFPIGGNTIQIIAIIVFVIGAITSWVSSEKSRGYR